MLQDVLIPAFWHTATQLVSLIVPVLSIYMVMRIAADLILGDRR